MNNYFLGLNLGTGSLGWAVTDKDYAILRAHGKALWGVRLFDSANTAEERRNYRTARRRLDRRNWRIELLQAIFADEIMAVDDGFYHRMKESRYMPEDKLKEDGDAPELPYALFVDPGFTDKDYHQKFPTIYHLRKWLMSTDETPDVRLIYLALHHMMKHRGHFLFSGSLQDIKEFNQTFRQLVKSITDEELDFHISADGGAACVEAVLRDSSLSSSAKKSQLVKMLGAKTACEKAVIALITGNTVRLSDIFGNSELDNCERSKISFSDSRYEEYASETELVLGEQYFLIEQAKAVYDWSVMADIFDGCDSLSEAKVAVYDKHKKDLAYLKKLVRDNLSRETYNEIFVQSDDKLANYSAYIGTSSINGKKVQSGGKQCGRDEFYAYLKKIVLGQIEEDKTEYLREEMDKGTFLPKQVTKENSVLPYQAHLYELNMIIDNLQNRVPVLKDNADKIRGIFTFRIPYYVGPLNGVMRGNKKTNWAQRRCGKTVYPWNFEDVIDVEASAEQFIRRMTNKCTYLIHEDVLPKNSLLYSRFAVLNELNSMRINGEPVSVELKQRIYNELFLHTRIVTKKKLQEFLIREGIADKGADITGIGANFRGSLTAYHDFREQLEECELSDEDKENIILNITLFGHDKKLLARRLEVLYPNLTRAQQRKLCMLPYKGWGSLSERFLGGITAPNPGGGRTSKHY